MAFTEGTLLGPYKIVSLLGAGGMGEVYRAYDPRLDRQVAIKVLPSNLFSDPDRLRRFDQEARAAGGLNHPNIVVVHDVGLHNGSPYLVTELLEGETLRERFKRGRIPKLKAIEYATQIARGVAAAHEKGIVHRDLKPENIFICSDERIKILDFGLAKFTGRNEQEGTSSNLVTATLAGTILGTVGYMSPEQVQGMPADIRSDIFSFGAILFEMLAGKRAFQGNSGVEILNSILKDEPPELMQRSEDFPAMLQRLARSCLEKKPENRFQSMRDLAVVLEGFTSSADATGESENAHTPEASQLFFRRITFQQGRIWSARFAPDGSTIVYGASWNGEPCKLFLTRAEASESLPLPLPEADILSISSKGEMAISLGRHFEVGYESSGTLAHLPMTGGAPREIQEDVEDADWTADGTDFVVARRIKGQYCIEFPMGNVIHRAAGWCNDPRISPDGKFIAFVDHPNHSGDDAGSIVIVDTSGNQKVVSEGWTTIQGIAWSPDGSEVCFVGAKKSVDRAVHAISKSGNLRTILRSPVALEMHDISREGRVLISRTDQSRRIGGLIGNDPRERDLTALNWSFPCSISPDGQKILFVEQGGRPVINKVYLRRTDGSPGLQIGEGFAMDMSPDWKWALVLMENGQLALLPAGAGKQKFFPNQGLVYRWAKWFPDQKRIVFSASESGHLQRLYVQNLNDEKPVPITEEGAGHFDIFMTAGVSPDGKSVAGWNADRALTLFFLEDGKQQPLPETSVGQVAICWSKDSNFLYTVVTRGIPAGIFRVNLKTGHGELWKEIWPANSAGVDGLSPVLMSADLQSIVYSYRRVLSDLYLAEGLR